MRFPGQLPHGGAAATLIVSERLAERAPVATSPGPLNYDAPQMRISALGLTLRRRIGPADHGSLSEERTLILHRLALWLSKVALPVRRVPERIAQMRDEQLRFGTMRAPRKANRVNGR